MPTRDAANILNILDQLKRSIDHCHPQVPSLAVETALTIERYASSKNIDEFFAEKSIDDLNKLTKQFEINCMCESTRITYKKIQELSI